MIKRYSLPRMAKIWEEENKFKKMLKVEIAACEAMAKLGKVPKAAVTVIKKKAAFDVESGLQKVEVLIGKAGTLPLNVLGTRGGAEPVWTPAAR